MASFLGQGSFGKVFHMNDADGLPVACKVVKASSAKFQNEIAIMQVLCHRHVIALKNFHRAVFLDELHLLMELCPCDLAALIDSPLFIPGRMSKTFASHLLQGVSHIHDAGIVHCDIKPGNLLLSLQGMLKVADFGAAVRWSKTHSHANIVTLAYRPPELLLEIPFLDFGPPTDMWSLGVSFGILLCRSNFMFGQTVSAQRQAIAFVCGTPTTILPLEGKASATHWPEGANRWKGNARERVLEAVFYRSPSEAVALLSSILHLNPSVSNPKFTTFTQLTLCFVPIAGTHHSTGGSQLHLFLWALRIGPCALLH